MPTISMFYGILIQMYASDHAPPHLHAEYAGSRAVFDFNGTIIDGSLPRKQVRLIQAWIEIHKEELEGNWKLCERKEQPYKIEPLK